MHVGRGKKFPVARCQPAVACVGLTFWAMPVGLVLPDVLGTELIRAALEVPREVLDLVRYPCARVAFPRGRLRSSPLPSAADHLCPSPRRSTRSWPHGCERGFCAVVWSFEVEHCWWTPAILWEPSRSIAAA